MTKKVTYKLQKTILCLRLIYDNNIYNLYYMFFIKHYCVNKLMANYCLN